MPLNRPKSVIAASVLAASLMLALAALLAAPVVAQAPAERPPGELASFYSVWPMAGHEMQFEAAIKEHVAWRKQAGEGWTWEVYVPVLGTDMANYVFRSGDHHWADFDANDAWEMTSKADEMFQKSVAPHVARYEHTIAVEDYEHSHWVMAEDYKYFRVTEYELNSGAASAIREAIDTIHKGLMAGGWQRSYAISRTIGGTGGLTIVGPYRSWAEMEDPKPSMIEVLGKGVGSEAAAKAALQKFGDGIKKSNTSIYMARPDLSTPK